MVRPSHLWAKERTAGRKSQAQGSQGAPTQPKAPPATAPSKRRRGSEGEVGSGTKIDEVAVPGPGTSTAKASSHTRPSTIKNTDTGASASSSSRNRAGDDPEAKAAALVLLSLRDVHVDQERYSSSSSSLSSSASSVTPPTTFAADRLKPAPPHLHPSLKVNQGHNSARLRVLPPIAPRPSQEASERPGSWADTVVSPAVHSFRVSHKAATSQSSTFPTFASRTGARQAPSLCDQLITRTPPDSSAESPISPSTPLQDQLPTPVSDSFALPSPVVVAQDLASSPPPTAAEEKVHWKERQQVF